MKHLCAAWHQCRMLLLLLRGKHARNENKATLHMQHAATLRRGASWCQRYVCVQQRCHEWLTPHIHIQSETAEILDVSDVVCDKGHSVIVYHQNKAASAVHRAMREYSEALIHEALDVQARCHKAACL